MEREEALPPLDTHCFDCSDGGLSDLFFADEKVPGVVVEFLGRQHAKGKEVSRRAPGSEEENAS